MADITVTAKALPLPLAKKLSEQPPSNALPLTLNRKLGTLEAVAPPIKRTMSGVGMALSQPQQQSVDIKQGNQALRLGIAISETAKAYRQMGVNIGDDYASLLKPFINLGIIIEQNTGIAHRV